MDELRPWWNSLDFYWQRVFKIMLKSELESNKSARDAYVPTDETLVQFTAIEELAIRNSSVTNLDPLKAFHKLRKLEVTGLNALKSADALRELKSLDHLEIDFPEGLMPVITGLTGLQSLVLKSRLNTVDSIKPLKNLRRLVLQMPLLTSFDGIAELTSLEELFLFQTTVQDIGSLAALKNLQKLTISNGNITSIEALQSLSQLRELTLYNVPLKSLNGIEGLVNLVSLKLLSVNAKDLSKLSGLAKLSELDISGSYIESVDQIYKLPLLKKLTLNVSSFEIEEIEKLQSDFPQYNIPTPGLVWTQGKHYLVLETFQSGDQKIEKGMKLSLLDTSFNPHESIINCRFKNLETGEQIRWSYYDMESGENDKYFQLIRYPKT